MADEYHVAPSLVALRTEINRRWPNRDKTSDGAIGDTAHAARKSDHNPDYAAGGVVRAIDVDKDGIVIAELLAAVVRDPRVAYVIWNKRIASATDDGVPWDWEPYNGENDHTHHIHISIKHTRTAETNTSKWFKADPSEDDMPLTDADLDKIEERSYQGGLRADRQQDKALWTAPTGTGTALIKAVASLTGMVSALAKQVSSEDVADDAEFKAAMARLDTTLADLKISIEEPDPETPPKA